MNTENIYTLRCIACGAKNRIPAAKLGQAAKCGKCRTTLPVDALSAARPVPVTDADFHDKVLKSPLPVLLDCWAPWCGPCRMMEPVLEQLAAEWKGRMRVCKLNVDENPGTAAQFQTRSIPTLLVFDNGVLKDTLVGAVPKHQIVQKVSGYL